MRNEYTSMAAADGWMIMIDKSNEWAIPLRIHPLTLLYIAVSSFPDSDKLEPMVMVVKHKEDCEPEYDNTKDKEEPDEILHIVSEVGSIIFLVPVTNLFAFVSKHFIDLMDMLLHLSSHPLPFFAK